jgi:hypothetical protein
MAGGPESRPPLVMVFMITQQIQQIPAISAATPADLDT